MNGTFPLRKLALVAALTSTATVAAWVLVGSAPFATNATATPTIGELKPQRSIKPRDAWFYRQRSYPASAIPPAARQQGLFQAESVPEVRFTKANADNAWRLVGPIGFESAVEPTWSTMSGRVRDLAIDPVDPQRLFLATATGGVWRSVDGGDSWSPLTDDQASLSIGAVAIAPSAPSTVYVGTGEGNGTYFSAGLLKSLDSGDSWTQLGQSLFDRGSIAGLEISPTDSDRLIVCATDGSELNANPAGSGVAGIFISTDGGSSFTQTHPAGCGTLAVDPSNADTLYFSAIGSGAQNGLYKSTDAGLTWSRLDQAPSGGALGRLGIGISASGTTIYIGGAFDDGRVTLQKSTDAGATWSELTPAGPAATYCEIQCTYNNVITVDPADDNDVFFGGVGLYRTRDGGQTFETVGNNNVGGGPLHVDHHVLTYGPGGVLYSGNDGGIYRSMDDGISWAGLGATLATLQPYQISLHPTDPDVLFIGAQDNGTQRRTTSNLWSERNGGDGGYSAIHPTDPQIVFSSTTQLSFFKSTDGGDTFSFISSEEMTMESRTGFISPLILDPSQPDTLYAASYRVWKSTDQGTTWSAISDDLTGGGVATVNHLTIAPSQPRTLYAVTTDGKVQRSDDSGTTWTDLTKAPLPNRWATHVAVASANPDIAIVTYSGFNTATPEAPGHVFGTSDGGATWQNISANLPDLPVQSVAMRPGAGDEVYLATDGGIFLSKDRGTNWLRMTRNLPNAGISSLAVNATTGLLAAATYGRSVWVTGLADDTSTLAAGFSFAPDQPTVGQTVQFSDTSVGQPTSWSWSFGDGTTSTEQNPAHIFAQAGTYDVRLEVSDGTTTDAMTRTVTVLPASDACVDNGETLCLQDGRFRITMTWMAGIESGVARVAEPRTSRSGLFYFFGADNWEVLVKVLDGCGLNEHYWVYSAAATNVGYTLKVDDTRSGTTRMYTKPPGPPSPAMADTTALATCP